MNIEHQYILRLINLIRTIWSIGHAPVWTYGTSLHSSSSLLYVYDRHVLRFSAHAPTLVLSFPKDSDLLQLSLLYRSYLPPLNTALMIPFPLTILS
jgi:hypothetical protein